MPSFTDGAVYYLCSAMSTIKKAVSSQISWANSLPHGVVSAAHGFVPDKADCGDRPLTPLDHSRLHVGSSMKFSTLANRYQKDRLKAPFASTLQFPGEELFVSVGQFVQLKTPYSHRVNWVVLVTGVHDVGFADSGFSGYFFYSEADIREYPHYSGFKASAANELFPTFHQYFFPLTTVLGPVSVIPSFLGMGEGDSYFYSDFFDVEKLCTRKIDLCVSCADCRLTLRYMRSDFICGNPQYVRMRECFVQMFNRKLGLYCQRKDFPHSRRGPRWTIEIQPMDAFLNLPSEMMQYCCYDERNLAFVLKVPSPRKLVDLFGKSREIVFVLARKTGQEILKFVVTGGVSIVFPFYGVEISVQIDGLRKFNGSGVLQWDSTKCGRRARSHIPSSASGRHFPTGIATGDAHIDDEPE